MGKAKESAQKDLEAARRKEIAVKKRVQAEINYKKATKMQFDSVDEAKTARISLDEAKKESDIKVAAGKLAGAKSAEARAKFAMRKGGDALAAFTNQEHDLSEAKAGSDEALRAAAKQMRNNKELDGKMEA